MGEAAKAVASTKVVTGVVRGSYLNLFEPKPGKKPTDTPKYQMTLLIPKTDTTTVAKIRAAQEAAANAKWPNKRPAKLGFTMHDGDLERPSDGEKFGPECKGHYVMSVASKNRPGIVDAKLNEIIDKGACISGDYFKVSINAYGFDVDGNKGVSFGLNNVQFIRKGEPLAGKTRAEDDFEAEDDESDF